MLPTTKPITQEYGWTPFAKSGAYGGLIHNGLDFAVTYEQWGSPALFLTIIFTGWDSSGFGNLVKARDQYGYTHWFAHNSVFLVSVGHQITIGQSHAISGSSGFSTAPHGHWSVQLPGYGGYTGFINPRSWPGFTNDQPGTQVASTPDLIDEVYLHIYDRGADAAALQNRQTQTRPQIQADLLASPEYEVRLSQELNKMGFEVPVGFIEACRKAKLPVKVAALNFARDRLTEETNYTPVTETLYKRR